MVAAARPVSAVTAPWGVGRPRTEAPRGENLVVTAEWPFVERTSSQIHGNLARREIEEVPSNSRNFTDLAQLIPGMTPNPGGAGAIINQVTRGGTNDIRGRFPAQAATFIKELRKGSVQGGRQ